jgi:hypothetical protein
MKLPELDAVDRQYALYFACSLLVISAALALVASLC